MRERQRSMATRLRLPDFLIAGAARSGTTWLCHLLDRHPEVFLARPLRPEPKFFLIPELYARGLSHYSATWFNQAAPDQRVGEKSTNYLESAEAAQRIHQHLPNVKLVFMLREPMSRAYSNYRWSRANGLETESFERALALEAEREATVPAHLRFARPHAYFSRGLYADLLAPYVKLFPRERILCLRTEQLATTPQEVAARLHRFLDMHPRPTDADNLGVINRSPGTELIPARVRTELAARYAGPNRRLAQLLGEDLTSWEVS